MHSLRFLEQKSSDHESTTLTTQPSLSIGTCQGPIWTGRKNLQKKGRKKKVPKYAQSEPDPPDRDSATRGAKPRGGRKFGVRKRGSTELTESGCLFLSMRRWSQLAFPTTARSGRTFKGPHQIVDGSERMRICHSSFLRNHHLQTLEQKASGSQGTLANDLAAYLTNTRSTSCRKNKR